MAFQIDMTPTPLDPKTAAIVAADLERMAEDGERIEIRDFQGGRKVIVSIFPDGHEEWF